MKRLYTYVKEELNINLNEAVSNADFEKARQICSKYLSKYGIHIMPTIDNCQVDGDWSYFASIGFNAKTNIGCALLWKQGSINSELSGICFYDDASQLIYAQQEGLNYKADSWLNTDGISLAKVIPLIKNVLTGKVKTDQKAIAKNLNMIDEDFFSECTVLLEDELSDLMKQKDKLYHKVNYGKISDTEKQSLQTELEDVKSRILEIRCAGRTSTKFNKDSEIDAVEQEFEERATPEQRFTDMEHYVKLVLNGIQPSLIVSGAPGVGKTYRITKLIEKKHTLGSDYYTIKGKCTAQKLFMTLFDYHNEGDILVIDDADDIITDDLCVNLLKAATDSSDKRIVSYGTSRAPLADDNMVALHPDWEWDRQMRGGKDLVFYPASFQYKGSIIIITNMAAGQLDTALRNRSFVCDLAFTTEEVLGVVKSLIPVIAPGKLDSQSKIKAYDYLEELAASGSKMEISIRSFTTVAKLFQACENDDDSAQRMIREQMKLQFARGGKKY